MQPHGLAFVTRLSTQAEALTLFKNFVPPYRTPIEKKAVFSQRENKTKGDIANQLKKNKAMKNFTLEHKENIDKELCNIFCGLDISKVKSKLGYWWILNTYNLSGNKNTYTFARAGQGSITFETDNKNIVIDCKDLGRIWR